MGLAGLSRGRLLWHYIRGSYRGVLGIPRKRLIGRVVTDLLGLGIPYSPKSATRPPSNSVAPPFPMYHLIGAHTQSDSRKFVTARRSGATCQVLNPRS
jgi:hypothetical protein